MATEGQSSAYTASVEQRIEHIQEDQELLSGKIDDQYQTKVESASKYRVRFSGIVLFNLFGNSGSVDNEDVPTWSTRTHPADSSGSVGAHHAPVDSRLRDLRAGLVRRAHQRERQLRLRRRLSRQPTTE